MKFAVEFKNGDVVEVKAKNGDDAKRQAYAVQIEKFPGKEKSDPGRQCARVIYPDDAPTD